MKELARPRCCEQFFSQLQMRLISPTSPRTEKTGLNLSFYLFWILSFLMLTIASLHAEVTTHVSPDKIQMDDTVRLTLTIEGASSDGVPDLTPLQKDFFIVGSERSMSYTFINGKTRAVKQWHVILKPKKTGVLSIPAIQIGQASSKAMTVEVTEEAFLPNDKPSTGGSPDEAVWLETEVNPKTPYIHQQVLYTVKLYHNGQLFNPNYQPPSVKHALMIPLGDARQYETTRNGRPYIVEQQQYAIFPQKSGELQVTGPAFRALVQEMVPRRVTVPPTLKTLSVKPIPQGHPGTDWLPAESVQLNEHYDQVHNQLSQGSTITRTVTIEARGVPAQLLPTLNFETGQLYQTYPEKPQEQNLMRDHTLVGQVSIKVTYLLNQPGTITIPELKLPWFNTKTGQNVEATLPERTIKVLPDAPQKPKRDHSGVTSTIEPQPESSPAASSSQPSSVNQQKGSLAWWFAAGFALAWLTTLLLWWRYRKHAGQVNQRHHLKALQQACENNHPAMARDALIRWAACRWPEVQFLNLNDVAKKISASNFKKQIILLSDVLYNPAKKTAWQGAELWQEVLKHQKKKTVRQRKKNDLPPMNPFS